MDTDFEKSARKTNKSVSFPLIGFIGGLIILVVGILSAVGLVTAIGFGVMVVSFMILNFSLAMRYGSRRFTVESNRKFTTRVF